MRLTRHFFTDFGMGRIWFPRAGSQGLDEVPGCPGGARVAIDQRGEVAEASFGRKKNTDPLGCGAVLVTSWHQDRRQFSNLRCPCPGSRRPKLDSASASIAGKEGKFRVIAECYELMASIAGVLTDGLKPTPLVKGRMPAQGASESEHRIIKFRG